jgi:hypothetical protein
MGGTEAETGQATGGHQEDQRRAGTPRRQRRRRGQIGIKHELRVREREKAYALIPCQASCTSQRNQKSELMEKASTIHLYTSTAPLTCDGRRESQHVDTDRRRESQHVHKNGRRESQHMETKGGESNFTINCETRTRTQDPGL